MGNDAFTGEKIIRVENSNDIGPCELKPGVEGVVRALVGLAEQNSSDVRGCSA